MGQHPAMPLTKTSAHKVMNAPVSRIDLAQAKLEPGSEPERTSAVIVGDVFFLLDLAAHKISRYAPLVPHAQFALQPTVENSVTVPVGLRSKDPSNA